MCAIPQVSLSHAESPAPWSGGSPSWVRLTPVSPSAGFASDAADRRRDLDREPPGRLRRQAAAAGIERALSRYPRPPTALRCPRSTGTTASPAGARPLPQPRTVSPTTVTTAHFRASSNAIGEAHLSFTAFAAPRSGRAPGGERSHTTDNHSATSNRSKADQDPSTWLPPNADCRRTYITNWVADGTRYRLTIDPTGQSALAEVLPPAPTRRSRSPSPVNQAVLARRYGGSDGPGLPLRCHTRSSVRSTSHDATSRAGRHPGRAAV